MAPNLQYHHCFHRLSEISVLGAPVYMACKTEYLDKSSGGKAPSGPSELRADFALSACCHSRQFGLSWPERSKLVYLCYVMQSHQSDINVDVLK